MPDFRFIVFYLAILMVFPVTVHAFSENQLVVDRLAFPESNSLLNKRSDSVEFYVYPLANAGLSRDIGIESILNKIEMATDIKINENNKKPNFFIFFYHNFRDLAVTDVENIRRIIKSFYRNDSDYKQKILSDIGRNNECFVRTITNRKYIVIGTLVFVNREKSDYKKGICIVKSFLMGFGLINTNELNKKYINVLNKKIKVNEKVFEHLEKIYSGNVAAGINRAELLSVLYP